MNLNVSLIKIRNVLGIESLDIKPGKFTVIRGRNGSGKSSAIEAIKAALGSGHDATLLRDGAEKGETVLVLDDGTNIGKTITAAKSTRSGQTASEVRDLIDSLSVNPIEFLTVDRKKQITALMEAMPMRADLAKLAEITGAPVAPELAQAHALTAIEAVYDGVYQNRTGVNRSIKDKGGTIRQLEETIPAALAATDAVDETALDESIAAADAARDAELVRVDEKLALMETAWQTRMDELQVEIDNAKGDIDTIKAERERIRGAADKQRQRARDKCNTEKQPFNDRLLLIRSNRDAAAKARATRETIDQMHKDLKALEAESQAATDALAALETYKADLLSSLPIPGLRVDGGEIYYGKVLFERLNTAEQMKVAVEIAKLRAGPLGLVCVDGIERLNDEAFAAFREQALASDVQMIVTRACDGPLTVEAS